MRSRGIPGACALGLWCLLATAHPARAHHDSPLPLTLNDAGAIGQMVNTTNRPQTSVGLSTRYMRLAPAGMGTGLPGVTVTGQQASLLVAQLEADWFVHKQVTLRLAAPLVMAFPEHDPSDVGAGDLRVGGWFTGQADAAQGWRLAGGLDLSLPTGAADHGFGAGDFLTRVAGSAGRSLVDGHLQLALETGLSWAWRSETSLAIDYGINALWMFGDHLGVGLLVRARTFLQDSPNEGAVSYGTAPGSAGDTVAVFMPGLSVALLDGLLISAGPQIPIGDRTFSFGLAAGLRYAI